MHVGGNVYYNGTGVYKFEKDAVNGGKISTPEIVKDDEKIVLKIKVDGTIDKAKTVLVDTKMLDKAYYSDGYYENADGTTLTIDTDYSGAKRNVSNPRLARLKI